MKRKIAIITGATGQDGAYLSAFLVGKKYRVIGVAPHVGSAHTARLRELGIEKKVTLIRGDVTNAAFLKQMVKKYHPFEWYNLAAISSVARSWEDPTATLHLNGESVIGMLEAIRSEYSATKFFQASSAEIYGDARGVITESTGRFQPLNPYGVGKLAAHLAVRMARERYGLFAVNGILFNHESPLRPETFVSKKIAQGVARIARGRGSSLELGNLAVRRNWTFAGDIAVGMWKMLQQQRPRDFVLCSAENYSIAEFVRAAFAHVGIRDWKAHVRVNPVLVRKSDVKNMRGSAAYARRVLLWKPTIDFYALVGMMVDYELAHTK